MSAHRRREQAAEGDESSRDELERALRAVDGRVDLILLAGDLTTYGELDQAELLAEICRPLSAPGTKGFVGGFPDSQLPDFGEPVLRQVYAETTVEVEALAAALGAIAGCDYRIVLLHYSPTMTTLEGNRAGSGRSSAPTAWRRRSPSTTRTSSCPATRTRTRSRARRRRSGPQRRAAPPRERVLRLRARRRFRQSRRGLVVRVD